MPDGGVKQLKGRRGPGPRRASRGVEGSEVRTTPRRKPEGLASHSVLLGAVSAIALAACAKIGEDVIDHDSLAFDRAVRDWTLANQRPRIRQAFSVATHAGAPSVVVPI